MPLPTETTPIDRRSARHAVFEQLRGWIEDGILEPGEAIKDAEIASQLGVSRTPVREALQMLERHGAVEMLPGRMTRVTTVGPDDVIKLYTPLGALMGVAAEMATPLVQPADIDTMKDYNERLLQALRDNDPVAARDADRAFHGILLARSDNAYLATAIEPLLIHARRLETLYFRHAKPGHASYQDHIEIIDAVTKRDVASAAALTRHNFTRFWTPTHISDDTGELSARGPSR